MRAVPAVAERHPGLVDRDFVDFRRHLRHDLRTPISAIKGLGEMLLEDAQSLGTHAGRVRYLEGRARGGCQQDSNSPRKGSVNLERSSCVDLVTRAEPIVRGRARGLRPIQTRHPFGDI
jgi:signal transduction histidine kinase